MKQLHTFKWIFAGVTTTALLLGVSVAAANRQLASAEQTLSPTLVKKVVQSTPVQASTSGGSNKPSDSRTVATKSSPVLPPIPSCTPVTSLTAPTANATIANPGFHERNLVSEYTVYGNDVGQINGQMYGCGPVIGGQHYAASTDYSIGWTYNLSGDENGVCRVNSVSVELINKQVLPTWQQSNASLAGRWNGFITNLRNHENGHTNINRSQAQSMYNQLSALPSGDCSAIDARANQIARQIFDTIERDNEAFDASNNHGISEGANL